MADRIEATCPRCRQALPAESRYCIACGFSGVDADSRKYGAQQEAHHRIERARQLAKLFRFLRWFHWVR